MANPRVHRLAGVAGVLALSGTVQCAADEIDLQPRVSGGTQAYSLTFADVIIPNGNGFHFQNGFKISNTLQFFGAGLTASSGRAFADVSGQWSGTGTDHGEIFEGTAYDAAHDTTPALGFEHHFDARFSRHELNFALGWAFDPNFSVFSGYKTARLNITQMLTPSSAFTPNVFDVLFIGDYTMNFSYHGFFVGATYSLPVRTWGALGIQTSVARLDSGFHQSFSGTLYVLIPTGPNSDAPLYLNPSYRSATVGGLSTGLNAGISWSGNFGWANDRLRTLSYTVGVDESQYRFSTSQTTYGDFEEKNTRVRLELRYRFAL
jgi:hypothetical protein